MKTLIDPRQADTHNPMTGLLLGLPGGSEAQPLTGVSQLDAFRWISIPLSMILGLGITRLLASMVAVFRSRTHAKLDWLPLVWAACIFMQHLQFWWAIIELASPTATWTVGAFILLVCLTLLLYVSAALVLPNIELKEGESLASSFQLDGRWALGSLSAYFGLALLADWLFWGAELGTVDTASILPLIALPLLYLCIRTRKLQVIVTLAYVFASTLSAWLLSPSSYS